MIDAAAHVQTKPWSSRRKKLVIGGIVLLIALGYAGYSAFKNMAGGYYQTVAELQAGGDSVDQQVTRVGGVVLPGSVKWDSQKSTLNFQLADEKNRQQLVSVTYKGQVPDNFKPGEVIIVVGQYQKSQEFIDAMSLTPKCREQYIPF